MQSVQTIQTVDTHTEIYIYIYIYIYRERERERERGNETDTKREVVWRRRKQTRHVDSTAVRRTECVAWRWLMMMTCFQLAVSDNVSTAELINHLTAAAEPRRAHTSADRLLSVCVQLTHSQRDEVTSVWERVVSVRLYALSDASTSLFCHDAMLPIHCSLCVEQMMRSSGVLPLYVSVWPLINLSPDFVEISRITIIIISFSSGSKAHEHETGNTQE